MIRKFQCKIRNRFFFQTGSC